MSSTFDKPPTKEELRARLEQAMADYVKQGGEIEKIPAGVSGREENSAFTSPLFTTPKNERTQVADVIATIESRRKTRARPPPASGRRSSRQPRLKVIYDDFGEPVRKIWVDE